MSARSRQRKCTRSETPAVVVGARAAGALGVIRSLSRADIPVILLDEDRFAPAMHSRYCRKIVISRANGRPLVQDLLALAAAIGRPAVLFLASDDAVLTVSEHRAELERHYRFRLPSHESLSLLTSKTRFQRMAEAFGFAVPRAIVVEHVGDLAGLAELRLPCIVKPGRSTADYIRHRFARGYKVASHEEAAAMCRRMLAVVTDVLVQEWIEGADSNLYFCLQYRGADGKTVSSFTGRKLSIWPPDVGVTASCTAAPESRSIVQPLTEALFDRLSFVGLGGIEFKWDARSGRFLMIEPTVGRVDAQEEVATINGVNIPLAVYLYEIGAKVPLAEHECRAGVWRDSLSHWRSTHRRRSQQAVTPNTKIYDAYWRRDDPLPALFHLLGGSMRLMRKAAAHAPPDR